MSKLETLNIREGTNKEKCAIVFLKDTEDRAAAVKKGVALGLQESTVRTWCSQWAAMLGGAKKKKKAPAKAVKKAAPAKAAKKAAPAKKPAAKKAVKRETMESRPAA